MLSKTRPELYLKLETLHPTAPAFSTVVMPCSGTFNYTQRYTHEYLTHKHIIRSSGKRRQLMTITDNMHNLRREFPTLKQQSRHPTLFPDFTLTFFFFFHFTLTSPQIGISRCPKRAVFWRFMIEGHDPDHSF